MSGNGLDEAIKKAKTPKAPSYTIRDASVTDAKALNDYMIATYKSAKHLITRPDEFRSQPFARRLWIAKKQLSHYETCIIAVSPTGQVVGMLECWTDRRARVHHITTFAMSVHSEFQRNGIGTDLLNYFITWVKNHTILQKIELHVHSDNEGAEKLYTALGFTYEGRRKAAIIYEDGRIVDDILMSLWPKGILETRHN